MIPSSPESLSEGKYVGLSDVTWEGRVCVARTLGIK